MGSGSGKRKPSDVGAPSVHAATTPTKSQGVAGSVSSQKQNFNPSVCPVSFVAKLPERPALPAGTKLTLVIVKDKIEIYAGVAKIAILTSRQAPLILLCIKGGVRYQGAVRRKGKDAYGDFRRTI